MSDKVKQLAPQIWQEIKKSNNILLHFHRSPDTDSAGSALAFMHMLKKIGKNPVVISGDSVPTEPLKHLPGFEFVVIKNYFEINPLDFDTFIALDSSTISQISGIDQIGFPPNLNVIKIDHHQNNADYGKINLVDTSYCATAHIVFDLFKIWKVKLDQNIAACLFAGIYSDTGGFKYPPTSFETLSAGAELVKIYPDYFKIIFYLENSRTAKQLEFLGLALSKIENCFSGKVAISFVSYDDLKKRGITKDDTKNVELPNTLKSVTGWIIGISFVETSEGNIEVGLRKREYEGPDLSKLAIALGGGGHKAAAGGSIKMPFADAKKFLLEKIAEVYPELGSP